MAHLFQANMPPMVEAKMIARMTQQIMIMIFFCSSRRREKKHMRNNITVQTEFPHKGDNVDQDTGGDMKERGDGSGFQNPECRNIPSK